jgi:hypothetical protein
MSTGSKARNGMYTFVAILFAAGLVIAGAYVIFTKPGESVDKSVSDVVAPNS